MKTIEVKTNIESLLAGLALALLVQPALCLAQESPQRKYEPRLESIKQHEVPEWYEDAKLGIFIHWGPYSVPAWAPTEGPQDKTDIKHNSYAEHYWNTVHIEGSPTQKHHAETYGADFDYYNFVPMLNNALQRWAPGEMAEAFNKAGARYVVLTSKHHDGVTLWPSRIDNPNLPDDVEALERDVVGELAEAVRARGMRYGLYYSGGRDWSFNPVVMDGSGNQDQVVPRSQEYADYADAHWSELIERYEPIILWNDITYPKKAEPLQFIAEHYNARPDGLINDRFSVGFTDFTTPEYDSTFTLTEEKWEATRGIAYSFGYNQNSGPEHMLSVDKLVNLLVDIVSKNGNLLLNVGPKADGTIPELQAERLQGLGQWLDTTGEAIYRTRPWVEAEGRTGECGAVRFTKKDDNVYAILLDTPLGAEVTIKGLQLAENTTVRLLGRARTLEWEQIGGNVRIRLPEGGIQEAPAHALEITPHPEYNRRRAKRSCSSS